MADLNGIVVVNKEKGYTSHDVVSIMRKILGTSKIGHTGTLDPNAEGVLPVCVGKSTRLADMLTFSDKEYIASVHLGRGNGQSGRQCFRGRTPCRRRKIQRRNLTAPPDVQRRKGQRQKAI